jgi:hypothetical protein
MSCAVCLKSSPVLLWSWPATSSTIEGNGGADVAERKPTQAQDEGKLAVAEVEALYKRATTGDAAAMGKLRKALDRVPGFWADMSLARQVEEGHLMRIAGDNLVLKEGLRRELRALKDGLAGPSCSPLEHLLIERIAACWLQVQWADYRGENIARDDLTLAQADYRQRRQDRAHRRLLSGVRTLALVRKLALPVLQVNVAEQQINVATGAPADADERS